MEDSSSAKGTVGPKVKQTAMSVEHPLLLRFDSESIRVFLRKYEAYCREVYASASQLTQDSAALLEPISPVGLIYCVDAEQLKSAIECGMIEGCDNVESLTSNELKRYLESRSQESVSVITEPELAKLVEATLRMDMSVKSATDRMQLLFMEYRSLLRTNGLKWVIERTPKVPIRHVLSVVRPT